MFKGLMGAYFGRKKVRKFNLQNIETIFMLPDVLCIINHLLKSY